MYEWFNLLVVVSNNVLSLLFPCTFKVFHASFLKILFYQVFRTYLLPFVEFSLLWFEICEPFLGSSTASLNN